MCSNILSITIYKKFVNILYTILTKINKECILIIVIDKNSFYQNISLFKEKIMETNDKKESLLFYEESTGKILRVAATADEYLFDWAVYNTENDEIISTFLKYKVNTLFNKKNTTEINKAVDTAMAISGINKLDVYILDQDEFEKKLNIMKKILSWIQKRIPFLKMKI